MVQFNKYIYIAFGQQTKLVLIGEGRTAKLTALHSSLFSIAAPVLPLLD